MTDKAKERNGRTSERTKVRREIIGGLLVAVVLHIASFNYIYNFLKKTAKIFENLIQRRFSGYLKDFLRLMYRFWFGFFMHCSCHACLSELA